MAFYGNPVGGFCYPKTFVLTDPNGTEVTGVVVDNLTVFDATPADVKVDKVFASDEGVQTGTDTKTYRVAVGTVLISSNSVFSIPLADYDMYNYSQFQAMIMPYNTSTSDSNAVDKVIINDNVFSTGSNTAISSVVKDSINKAINLGITNGNTRYLIRYFVVKEEIS